MTFDFFIPPYIIGLLLLSLLACAGVIIARFVPMMKVVRKASQDALLQEEVETFLSSPSGKLPKVSVIVHTFTTEELIIPYLETLMSQDYPDFEVVLVNEGNNEVTADMAERLMKLYPERLYVTFIPPDSHNLSRRKLALTLGIKAAHGDIVVTTASNCLIPSSSWLSLMIYPFIGQKHIDVVLGYAHIRQSDMRGPGKWYREFDDTVTAVQWLGSAVSDNPYRGDGNNLAYKRSVFFEQKGYSRSIHLVNGDDDLFVNDITDGFNTEVMLAPESILAVDWEAAANRIHGDLKERYQFTSSLLPSAPFLRAGLASSMQWLATLSAIAAALLPLPNLFPAAVALFILLALNITETIIYTKAAHRLGASSPRLVLPLFMLWLPLGNLFFRLNHRRHRKKNFTFSHTS